MAKRNGNTERQTMARLDAAARLEQAGACMASLTHFLSNREDCDLSDQQLAALSCAAETLIEGALALERT